MRYALCFAPKRQTALARFGARWLGRDAYSGEALEQPSIAGIDRGLFAETTVEPRRYGFHATLKPPFHLAKGADVEKLRSAIQAFTAKTSPVLLDRIAVKRIGRFLALTPVTPEPLLDSFAASVVEAFDAFRARPSQQEIERRKRNGLSAGQQAQLARWGYPYVMEEFRFHMTITGASDAAVLDRFEAAAKDYFNEITERPLLLDSLTLFVEPAPDALFQIEAQWPLAGQGDTEGAAVGISAPLGNGT